MAIKTIEAFRKIRDENYRATKNLSVEDQIKLINQKSKQFRKTCGQIDQESA